MNKMRSTRDQNINRPSHNDIERLNLLLNQIRQQYQRELSDAAYISFGDNLKDGLISLISFGLIHSNRLTEIENKKRKYIRNSADKLIKSKEESMRQTPISKV